MQSQRSCGSSPSASAEPSAFQVQLPIMSAIGLGSAVVPEVWTIVAGLSGLSHSSVSASGSVVRASGLSTVSFVPSMRCSRSPGPSRRSIGTIAAPSISVACRTARKGTPAGMASAIRSPLSMPFAWSTAAASRLAACSSACVVIVPSASITAGWSGLSAAARGSQGSRSIFI